MRGDDDVLADHSQPSDHLAEGRVLSPGHWAPRTRIIRTQEHIHAVEVIGPSQYRAAGTCLSGVSMWPRRSTFDTFRCDPP